MEKKNMGGRPKKQRPEDPVLARAREAKLLKGSWTLTSFRKTCALEPGDEETFGDAILAHQRRVIRQAIRELDAINSAAKRLGEEKSAVYKRLRGALLTPAIVKQIMAERRINDATRLQRDEEFDAYWRLVTLALGEADDRDQAEEREAAE